MRLIHRQFFSVVIRKWYWFKRVYLQLDLFSDGTWRLTINDRYQYEEVNYKTWRYIEKNCRNTIIAEQKKTLYHLMRQQEANKKIKHSHVDHILDVSWGEAFEIVASKVEYGRMFEGEYD